ncbi:proteasome assembly chaperone 4-like [Ylistrum balloti]|uniref:proteasome assembly chaperone 4-like n=1 Tax=Ylistrum balloti TaxID=509963 RepID=UPI002905D2C3|nr:proteasome assembly chaperone 4-like [Ylistrum balloti]
MAEKNVDDEVADKIPRMEDPMPSISVHTFHEKIMDSECFFQVVKLEDSFHLWLGNSPATFGSFTVAMQTKFDKLPSSVPLLGGIDSPSNSLALQLAKKTGKQVFVSCNLTFQGQIMSLIEKRISEELNKHPECF